MKELAKFLKDRFHFSERKACKVLEFSRSTCRYKSVAADETDLRKRIIYHAHKHARFGYRRIHVLLMREGRLINIKRVRRIYREESLSYRLSKRRRQRHSGKFFKPTAFHHNDHWSIDFVMDRTVKKRKLRMLTIVDNFTRESPGVLVDRQLKSKDVVRFLDILTKVKGKPAKIICDNGPEFISSKFKSWAKDNQIELNFIRPGTPSDNAFIESFNSRFREEFLNLNHFENIEEAQLKADEWRMYYNNERPHGSLGNKTPNEFIKMVRSVTNEDEFG